jgi:hypothetical protein
VLEINVLISYLISYILAGYPAKTVSGASLFKTLVFSCTCSQQKRGYAVRQEKNKSCRISFKNVAMTQ